MRYATLLFFTLILAASFAQAQEVPKRKSGLWEIKRMSTRTDDRPTTSQMCVDEATDNPLSRLAEGMRSESCQIEKMSRDGDKLVIDATCKLRQKSASKTHAVITGKFDSAYKIESKSTYDPPLAGMEEGHAVLEAKWTGPCQADQRPGDIILPGGKKVRVNEEAQAAKWKAELEAEAKAKPAKQKDKGNLMSIPSK
jgi:hypothetical protein